MLVKTLQKITITPMRSSPIADFIDWDICLTSITILFIGDAFQVQVMDPNGNIIHASFIPDL